MRPVGRTVAASGSADAVSVGAQFRYRDRNGKFAGWRRWRRHALVGARGNPGLAVGRREFKIKHLLAFVATCTSRKCAESAEHRGHEKIRRHAGFPMCPRYDVQTDRRCDVSPAAAGDAKNGKREQKAGIVGLRDRRQFRAARIIWLTSRPLCFTDKTIVRAASHTR